MIILHSVNVDRPANTA